MENKIIENLKSKVKESSTLLYMKNLKRLNGNQEIKNLNFLKDTPEIFSKIEKYKPNTQKTYLISIVSVLKAQPNMKKYHKTYYDAMMKLNGELKVNNTKSDSQSENWITQEEVLAKWEELKNLVPKDKKKLSEEEFYNLLEFVVLSLYVCQAPRRNADYQNNYIVKKMMPELPTEHNYTDIEKNEFVFNNYKTQSKYKTQIIPFNSELTSILTMWLKYHPLKKFLKSNPIPLLVSYEGEPFVQTNSITRILNKIFGKKIGVSMLRNIYLTDKFGDTIKDLHETTLDMGTSAGTAENNYIKID